MSYSDHTLGIDIGSISIGIVEITPAGSIVRTAYGFHQGQIPQTLKELLREFNAADIGYVGTTSSADPFISHAKSFDDRICTITAAKQLHKEVGSILTVGGENFGLALFDEQGEYKNYRSNSSCAAGTGGFLDQQAKRLNLAGINEFCDLAAGNTGAVPQIASRCAVFAKTDLIHAQQEGYTIAEIADGLSYGLAKNIVDTLFDKGEHVTPLIFTGGVSKNRAVTKHLTALLGHELIVDPLSHLYGAIGAAFASQMIHRAPLALSDFDSIHTGLMVKKEYFYEPLTLKLSHYPVFDGVQSYRFKSALYPAATDVEVDIYTHFTSGQTYPVFCGIDIGSTSTKAALLDRNREVLAALYTRTAGQPVTAAQTILEAIDNIQRGAGITFEITGFGTTGSGRKFIGKILGADLILDEITAHAKAAAELDPEVDTIIEIGGQDAKFTTLRRGIVTFSIMNNVCAAGTGSFIEEQAKKLGCPISEYAARASQVNAPLSSDRCTVFMERDLNHYINKGFNTNEILAAVLHSVRENYLRKVAIEDSIGSKIFFQGATAKNSALVAAFEQRLQKPIMVSRYCHITGAMGVALELIDMAQANSSFRGIHVYEESIPVASETCQHCINHCKLKVAKVEGETVAFGFLCGKEYNDNKRVEDSRVKFDLLKERRAIMRHHAPSKIQSTIKIGLPAALHLYEDLFFWKTFFHELGIETVSSEGYNQALAIGKQISGAEFCAPISALYGHMHYLAERTPFIFLPNYLEKAKRSTEDVRRQFCYFTQFGPAMAAATEEIAGKAQILSPVIQSRTQGIIGVGMELMRMLRRIGVDVNILGLTRAWDAATKADQKVSDGFSALYAKHSAPGGDIKVVMLGRPYTVLNPSMNKGIPELIAKQGVVTFFQDMIPQKPQAGSNAGEILNELHWNYAAQIIETAATVTHMDGIYPILVSSFKCTPDSYVMEYFKRLLDTEGKPYLILQLDDHDSNVGYETRIEAGIRAFRNHHAAKSSKQAASRSLSQYEALRGTASLRGKTLLLPVWDKPLCRLMEAVLKRENIDVKLIEESSDSIQRGLRFNSGQCLPLSIIAQNTIDTIERNGLDPAQTVVWTITSKIACGLGVFPHFLKETLTSYGNGMEKVGIYSGELTMHDISLSTSVSACFATMFAGMVKRMACKIRPYEKVPGTTDQTVEKALDLLYYMFLKNRVPVDSIVDYVVTLFEQIEVVAANRPKVAIFGDFYVRDNDTLNQGLIRTIEQHGGEVITIPYNEYLKLIATPYIKRWMMEGHYKDAATARLLTGVMPALEKRYYKMFNRVIKEQDTGHAVPYEELMNEMNITPHHAGEALDNILKVFSLAKRYPDLAFFVQTNPAYCCPSLVTESMTRKLEQLTSIPVVTIEYDGIGGTKNNDIIPYLKFPRKQAGGPAPVFGSQEPAPSSEYSL
jgi:predicted CoA-substrate-specific enzyme activase